MQGKGLLGSLTYNGMFTAGGSAAGPSGSGAAVDPVSINF